MAIMALALLAPGDVCTFLRRRNVDMQQDRIPVPSAAKQKEAEAEVREVYKAEYAKGDRRAMGAEFLKLALATNDDPAARYILLKEAAACGSQSGDYMTGLNALEELGQRYTVEGLPLKLAFLTDAARASSTVDQNRFLVDASLSLVTQAGENVALADGALAVAQAAARKSKELALVTRVDHRAKEIAAARSAADALKKARETLKSAPDDVAANLAVGRYECFLRGNWSAGLPLLVKGGDAVAAKDLANPADAAEQAAVADSWWDVGDKEGGEGRVRARKRAAEWYAKGLAGLSGLAKSKAEKRIADARGEDRSPGLVGLWSFEESSGTTSADGSGGGHPATLYRTATWGVGVSGGALKLDGTGACAEVADAPELNVDTDSFTAACFIRPDAVIQCRIINKFHYDQQKGWLLDINLTNGAPPVRLRARFCDGPNSYNHAPDIPLTAGVWAHVAVVLDRPLKQARLYLNGEQVGKPEPFATLGSLSVDAPLGIGDLPPKTGGFYNGLIDDVRLYRRVVTDAELKELAARK